MRRLEPHEMDRLVRSHRQMKISFLLTVTSVVVLIVLAIVTDLGFPAGLSAPVGGVVGLLLLIPNRRVLSQLGLTAFEAQAILEEERLRRSGVENLPLEVRARRETLRARLWLAAGLVGIVILVVAAQYFFSNAGDVKEEGEPTDVWFGLSFLAGFALIVFCPAALAQASTHRKNAADFRSRAANAAD